MSRKKEPNNSFKYVTYEGEECVEFVTDGKHKYPVIVDREIWDNYLKDFSWTALVSKSGRVTVKTSINKQSHTLWRAIVEYGYEEIDFWDSTIDHKNNNTLDNRLSNLKLYHATILNSTNVSSKYTEDGMHYIFLNGGKEKPNGYKVHFGLNKDNSYAHFGVKEFGSFEKALAKAKEYRDNVVLPERERIIQEMIKKNRDIEFERGLRDKIREGEFDEVLDVLARYYIKAEKIDT